MAGGVDGLVFDFDDGTFYSTYKKSTPNTMVSWLVNFNSWLFIAFNSWLFIAYHYSYSQMS
jgi:hypothetical protein